MRKERKRGRKGVVGLREARPWLFASIIELNFFVGAVFQPLHALSL